MTQKKKLPSFAEMEKVLLDCVKDGFISFSLEDRKKMLTEQKGEIELSERHFKLSQKQMQRQFSL